MSPAAEPILPDPILRFSIAPDASGGWRWDLKGPDASRLAGGLVATRKIAAAMVIKHIVQARSRSMAPPMTQAKAA